MPTLPTTPPIVGAITVVPNRATNTQKELSNNTDTMLGDLGDLQTEQNALADWENTTGAEMYNNAVEASDSAAGSANSALSSAASASQSLSYSENAKTYTNFEGVWSELSGAYNVGISVIYSDSNYYRLLSDTADISLIEPTVSAQWVLVEQMTPATIINDLSQSYIYPTVEAIRASLIVFPVGKIATITSRGGGRFEAVSAITNIPDGFGILRGIGAIAWKVIIEDEFDSRWYGAEVDGDNTGAIQATLNAAGTDLDKQAAPTQVVLVPAGISYISAPMFVPSSNLHFKSKGGAVLIATDAISNIEFILTSGRESGGAINKVYNLLVEDIYFERINSNPFRSGYDSATFKSGSNYTFINSCGGINLSDSHYTTLKRCKFIGLRLGVRQAGSWLSKMEDCQFFYNDRHVFGVNSSFRESNNANAFNECIFGTSVMPAGIYLEGYDDVEFHNTDFENASQTPYLLRSCRGVKFTGYTHFENNNKYRLAGSLPSYLFDTDVGGFMPVANDIALGDPSNYGTELILSTCQAVALDGISAGNADSSVLVVNSNCRDDIVISNSIWFKFGSAIPIDKMCVNHDSTKSGIILHNLNTTYWHMLGDVKQHNTLPIPDEDVACPTVIYVDPDNGDDTIRTVDSSLLTPIKNTDFSAFPSNAGTYEIHRIGAGMHTMELPVSDCKTVNVVCESGAHTGRVASNGARHLSVSGVGGLFSYVDKGENLDFVKLSDLIIDFDKSAGLLVGISNATALIDNCDVTQNNAVNYTFVVKDGTTVFAKNSTFNKRIEVRDAGIYYTKGNTEPAPVVQNGAIGKIETIV